MGDHYYSEQPHSESDPRTGDTVLRGFSYRFMSDAGVFSKRGVDFGSRLLIEAFQFPDRDGRILDIGCGYGAIGLALAKEQPSRVTVLVDINKRAVDLARKNARINHIDNTVVFQSDLCRQVKGSDFAVMVSNPPVRAGKPLLYRLFHEACGRLQAGGEFWVVIRKQQGAASAFNKLAELFSEVSVVKKKKGYVVMRAGKK